MPALAHIEIGLATKRVFPETPLWASLLSTMFLDILSVLFIFAI